MNREDMMPTLNVGSYTPPAEHPATSAAQAAVQVQEQGMQEMMAALQQQGADHMMRQKQNAEMFRASLNGMMSNGG